MQILFIGCGNMGGAIFKAILNSENFKTDITIIKQNNNISSLDLNEDEQYKAKEKNLAIYSDWNQLPSNFKADIIILGVKPYIIDQILPYLRQKGWHDSLVISILSGKSLDFFYNELPGFNNIIRAMPNLPVKLGFGVTGLYTKSDLDQELRQVTDDVFKIMGKTVWLSSDAEIDMISTISGSGPAYYYFFNECLIEAAKDLGLVHIEDMKEIMLYNFYGSALLAFNSKEEFADLRSKVTSKKGTTEKAIAEFARNDHFLNITKKAVKAAFKRAQEIAKVKD